MTNLEKSVAKFLKNRSNFLSIKFSFNGKSISPGTFETVGKRIGDGISVAVTNSGDKCGGYNQWTNKLSLPKMKLDDMIVLGGLIVHEAVHASSDIAGKTVSVETDEGCAYIAQALFLISQNGVGGFDKKDAPLRDMALAVSGGGGLTDFKQTKAAFVAWMKTTAHGKAGNTGNYDYNGAPSKK